MKHMVRDGWDEMHLNVLAEFQNGGAWKESEYADEGISVVRVTNCKDGSVDLSDCKFLSPSSFEKYAKHELRTGELIVATVGSHPTQPGSVVGRTSVVPVSANGALLNQNAVRLRANQSVADQRYLNYASMTPEFRNYIIAHARGAANQVRMSIGLLKEMSLRVPPLPTQRRIASILSAYDDLIENNTRRIAILEEMARRLYEEWFVEFRFPGHEGVSFEAGAEGARYPSNWELARLEDYIELAYGKALKKSDRVDGPYPVYGSSGVVGSHESYLAEGPGIIVGRKGNVGSVFWTDQSFFPIDTVYYVKTSLPLEYVFFNLQHQNFINNDAAVPGLNRNQAYSLPFLRPDDRVLRAFGKQCGALYELVRLLHRKNTNLRAQRDLLLPKLVSGEIHVSGIDLPDTEREAAA